MDSVSRFLGSGFSHESTATFPMIILVAPFLYFFSQKHEDICNSGCTASVKDTVSKIFGHQHPGTGSGIGSGSELKPVSSHNIEKKLLALIHMCKIGLRLTTREVCRERRAVGRQRGLCQMNNNFYAKNKGNWYNSTDPSNRAN
jgi:hypothetical protein